MRIIANKKTESNFCCSLFSVRLRSNTCIKTENDTYHLADNYVTYFPARLEYTRNSVVEELIVIHFDTNYYNMGNIEYFVAKNPDRFRKLFKDEFGISPKKHIIKLRIQNAVYLISTGYYSLKEVADLSGYEDYKHFSVEFKKIMGVSPSKYLYRFDG